MSSRYYILYLKDEYIDNWFCSAHQKFKALAPERVGHNKNAKLPMTKILQYPELKVNPFGDRICKIFSSSHDGDCTFEDFLDMMSVFSETAPKSVKAEHAFRMFGKSNKLPLFLCSDRIGTGILQNSIIINICYLLLCFLYFFEDLLIIFP